jgi:hypothetical protein
MGEFRRNLGWCLLLASILSWLGCKQQAPRPETQVIAHHRPVPCTAPVLEITAPPLLATASPEDQPRLLPPVSAHGASSPKPAPATPPAVDEHAPLRTIHRLAVKRLANTPAFLARLRRREIVDGQQLPEELILFKYRNDPPSIYMRWLSEYAKNRELVYVLGQYNNLVSILPGLNDPLALASNARRPLARPDSAEVLGKARYAISETGIAAMIQRFGRLIDAVDCHDPTVGSLQYLGVVLRPEFDAPVEGVLQQIPPGAEKMEQGGQRLWCFDTTLRFPVLVSTKDASDNEVEYYCLDSFLFPGPLSNDEFNPAHLGRP